MTNDENSRFMNVLMLFATYGFRKASMGDIANAAGLSRQSIYNQFGSKEAVFDWATGNMLDQITTDALQILANANGAPDAVLSDAFQAWIGDYVQIINGTPHGGDILEAAKATAAEASRDHEQEITDGLVIFLEQHTNASSAFEADEAVFVLMSASKGLLLKTETADAFKADMQRVIDFVLGLL